MVRAERVFLLLELLRGSDALTAAQLAERLGVSERTVHRDLATLRRTGTPLEAESGPGGGVRLQRERGLTAVHLSEDEVVALWMGAQLSRLTSALPWGKGQRSGLDKLFASVPRERARSARALCRRVVVGRPASERIVAQLGEAPGELLAAFERAFREEVCLAFDYRDREGRASRRLVEPHGLLVEAPAWYILALDVERQGARMFRMDRIRRPALRPERPFVPDFEGLRARHQAQVEEERRRRREGVQG
jgi:predicted DNA-binding transcriptional regulator YafY